MGTRGWQRRIAQALLVTFTTAIAGCDPSGSEPAPTTTLSAPIVTTLPSAPSTLPPPTLPPPPPTLPAQPPQQLGKEALRDLVAPVALYPDVVLASLLPATTYPDQIHEAVGVLGPSGSVPRVPDDRGWDGSVLGLLQFPDVLRWLDANPAWTDEMGQAVTYQQGDVLQAIQDYRRLVRDAGNLQSNQYQRITQANPDADIRIEPARPDIVYVPSYDTAAALQPQPAQPGINPWLAFGGGAVVGALGAWALYSIFDDDDDREVHHYYHGRRGINRYDNYYYAGRRRPRRTEWRPRDRPYRAQQDVARPTRLEHRAGSSRSGQPLRAPTTGPGETRREGRQERREQRQTQKQEHRMQRQERRETQRENRQQQRDQRQERREGGQQRRQQQRQDQRQQQQQHRTERREQRQDQQQLRRDRRQEHRTERRERRQETQAERRKRRQGEGKTE